MHRRLPIYQLIAIVALTTFGVGQSLLHERTGPLSWTGETDFVTEPFYGSGSWQVTLDAWCFEGVGYVVVAAYNDAGQELGSTAVLGEGTESVTFDTEPGLYHLKVTVSHWHEYTWELDVVPVDGDVARL